MAIDSSGGCHYNITHEVTLMGMTAAERDKRISLALDAAAGWAQDALDRFEHGDHAAAAVALENANDSLERAKELFAEEPEPTSDRDAAAWRHIKEAREGAR